MHINTTQAVTAHGTANKSFRSWSIAASICLCLPLLLLPACGAAPAVQDLTGTWEGTLTGIRGDQGGAVITDEVVFELVQIDDAVTGTFATQGGATGDLTGSLQSGEYVFTITQTGICVGSFTGTAAISAVNGLLEGSYEGSDCAGSIEASFTAARLP